jgi:hypothetical protein
MLQVEVTIRGDVPGEAREHAKEKVGALDRLVDIPVLGARVVLVRDLSVRLSQAPGASNQVSVAVIVNGGAFTNFFCSASGSQTSCSDVTDTAPVPGGSTLVVQLLETPTTTIPALSALVGFRLTPN